jgi:hypothetical protein
MWLNLPAGKEKFNFGPGLRGHGQVVYNNVASSKWDTHC